MSDKNSKDIRKQLRNVIKEELEGLLKAELIASIHSDLKKQVDARLDAIDKHLRSVLESVDARSKDLTSYVLRSIKPAPSTPSVKEEGSKND